MRLIFGIFALCSSLLFANFSHQEAKEFVVGELPLLTGWCSPKKAEAMMDLIFETTPQVCVELGVFGGSSLFPTAYALKCANQGVVYGIDAWDVDEAIKYYPKGGVHRDWWGSQDMGFYYNRCMRMIQTYQLKPFCIVLKETFATASSQIPAIDILHIDATHTNEGDFIDVIPYIRKLKTKGYIWFDGWANSPDTYEYLKSRCHIKKVIDSGKCILLQKISEDA